MASSLTLNPSTRLGQRATAGRPAQSLSERAAVLPSRAVRGSLDVLLSSRIAERDSERKALSQGCIPWSDLDVRQMLGEGSFGSVRLAVHKSSGTAYALKSLHKGHLISTGQVQNTVNEKAVLQQCAHPFILECHGSFNREKHVMLLLGLAQGGELYGRVETVGPRRPLLAHTPAFPPQCAAPTSGCVLRLPAHALRAVHPQVDRLSEPDAALYVAMAASALGFLTARRIAHRDLKLENLLIDGQGYLKLVDFGFAKEIADKTWTFCGTPDYIAPEILAHRGHNCAVDWWTLGILTYEMLHGEPPFADDDQMATFKRIAKGSYKVGAHVSAHAADLIAKLLVKLPFKRLGMLAGVEDDVLTHPMCKSIDKGKLLTKALRPPWVPSLEDPTDTSAFEAMGDGVDLASKRYDRYIDAKYEELWQREFA